MCSSSQFGPFVADFQLLFKLTLLNKKLQISLNLKKAYVYMDRKTRVNLYAQKCKVYSKQVEHVKKTLQIENNNKLRQNDAKMIYQILMNKVNGKDGCLLEENVRAQIKCDLPRTNTTNRVRTKEGQQELQRVLQAIAYMFPTVGYCQGMNFIASVLLGICDNQEYKAFYVFIHLLQDKELRMESLFF